MTSIVEDVKLDFGDCLLKPKRSMLTGRQDIDLTRRYTFLHSKREYIGIPILASNMDGVGTFSMARVMEKHNLTTVVRKHYLFEEWKDAIESGVDHRNLVVSTGTNAEDYILLRKILETWDIPFLCIDVANAYQQNFITFVKRVRDDFPDMTIIAGNVITPETVEELLINGADIVKCGIGPGSVCTTRTVTGVGYPQLSGIIECADAAHGVGGLIISDGGCVHPGDVAKAFAAGADFVMLGGMLAGCDEGEYGDPVWSGGKAFVTFYGMSSKEAVKLHGARKDGYKTCEGRVVRIPYKGAVEPIIEEILGGVISACSYIGARRLKDMSKCATFIRCNNTHNMVFERYDVEK
jgi:GMP reductase